MTEGSLLPFALEGMIAPMLIAFAICGIAIWFRLRHLPAAALAAATLVPCMLAHTPIYPPARLLDYLPYFGLAAFLLFLPFDLKNVPGPFLHVIRWLFSLAAVWLLLKPMIAKWSIQEAAANLSVCTLLWAVIWDHIESVSKSRPTGMFMLVVAATGGGICLFEASSALLGQMSIAIGIALASWLFLTLVDPDMKPGHSGLAIAYTLFASLMLIGSYYSEIPRVVILLVLSTFLADLFVQILLQLKPDIPPRSAIRMTAALTLVPGSIVVGLSAMSFFFWS